MIEDRISYHSVSVHPSIISVSHNSINCSGSPYRPQIIPDQFHNNSHHGNISVIAKRKMSRSLDYLLFLSKPKHIRKAPHGKDYSFRLSFITLSLSSSQVHSDQEIKSQLLNQFFIEMARKWKVPAYIWRAEKQKNGKLHFHVITSRFIPWNELRNVWNRIQQKLGYVTRYRNDRELWHRDGFRYDPQYSPRWDRQAQYKAYNVGLRTDWDNPNSVDVHSVRHVGNVSSYLCKYLSKNAKDDKKLSKEQLELLRVSGRLWGCSINLSHLTGGRTDIDTGIEQEFERILGSQNVFQIHAQYYSVYYIDYSVLYRLGCKRLLDVFESFVRQKFPDHCTPSLF